MDDPLLALADDDALVDDQGWAALVAQAGGIDAAAALVALRDPVAAVALGAPHLARVVSRRRVTDADGGASFAAAVRAAGGAAHLPPTAGDLVAAALDVSRAVPSTRPAVALVAVCNVFRDSPADKRDLAAAALRLVSECGLPLLDPDATGLARRTGVDAVAHLLAALPAAAAIEVLAGAADGGVPDELTGTVAAAAVVATRLQGTLIGAPDLQSAKLPTRFAAAGLELAVSLYDEYLAASTGSSTPDQGDRVAPGALAELCAAFAADCGAPLIGPGSTTEALCGSDLAAADVRRLTEAWFVLRDRCRPEDPTDAATLARFVAEASGGGARRVLLPDFPAAELLPSGLLEPVVLFAATDLSSDTSRRSITAVLCDPALPWSPEELCEALGRFDELDEAVCSTAPEVAGEWSGFHVVAPRWLVERSQRRSGLAPWIARVPTVRGELAAAADGIGASRWVVLSSMLFEFRGTVDELVAITDTVAPPT